MVAVSRKSTKLETLQEVVDRTRRGGNGPSPLLTTDDYARDHVRILCEALQLRLARLYRDRDGYGYEIRITRAGSLLAAGEIEGAAAILDAAGAITRLTGEPPQGVLATLLQADGAGLVLDGLAARQYAPEMMRCVATGHLVVVDGTIRAVRRGERIRLQDVTASLPASRAARHLARQK